MFYMALHEGAPTGDFRDAYAFLSKANQAERSYERFRDAYLGIQSVEISEVNYVRGQTDEDEITSVNVTVRIVDEDGAATRYDTTYKVVIEEGEWRLDERTVEVLPCS
jgi:hypothetical protein